jgi:ribonuclease H2 subunit C
VVLQKTGQTLQASKLQGDVAEQLRRMEEGEDDDEMDMDVAMGAGGKEVEVKLMETKTTFDEVVIWGHEIVPEDDDVYVKGVEEWIAFAEAVGSSISISNTQLAMVLM